LVPSLLVALLTILLRNDFVAQLDTFIANVDRWPRYQFLHLILALATKGAEQIIIGIIFSLHKNLP
jgi:hypothetical protein